MNATLLYRAASVLLVVFAAGHTYGFLNFRPESLAGRALWEAMSTVQLQAGRGSFTYGRLYVGFGLYVSAYLLFTALLAWYLGALARNNPKAIGPLGWALFALQLVSLVLSLIYFAPPPAILSALVAACFGWASWMVQSKS